MDPSELKLTKIDQINRNGLNGLKCTKILR